MSDFARYSLPEIRRMRHIRDPDSPEGRALAREYEEYMARQSREFWATCAAATREVGAWPEWKKRAAETG